MGILGNSPLPRILLSEDDADIRHALSALLQDDGYEVIAVASIEAARDELLRDPSAVLLLDSQHSTQSGGFDWLADFSREGDAPRTVIVSGASEAEDVGRRFGIRAFRKPFDFEKLLEAIVSVTASDSRPRDSQLPG